METDSFFCQLFKQLPETLFEILGEPVPRGDAYRVDSIELKKALRVDGVYVPKEESMPLYFLEVQFQRLERFYANLFAKVFCFLDDNRPDQEWFAAAIFANRGIEPRNLGPYEDLLASRRVKRVYLSELDFAGKLSIGMSLVRLMLAAKDEQPQLIKELAEKVRSEIQDADRLASVIELIETAAMRLNPDKSIEEVRAMVLHDIRESKAWQEMRQEARQEGLKEGMAKVAKKLHTSGKPLKEIAELLDVSLEEVRKWTSKG